MIAGLGAAIAIFGLSWGSLAVSAHEASRRAYEREARRIGERSYDARRSDRHYEAVLAEHQRAAWAGWVSALGIVTTALGLGARARTVASTERSAAERGVATRGGGPGGVSPPEVIEEGEPAPTRAWAALVLDGIFIAVFLFASIALGSALGAEHAALAALIARAANATALGTLWGGLAAGATPGARALGIHAHAGEHPPGIVRALVALALGALVLPLAPFALVVRQTVPLHLRWAGLSASRRGSGRRSPF